MIQNNQTLKRWLWLGIAALALAGLFAILLVIARSPVVQDIIPVGDIFHKALTVHVNLSVLVWFLAFACVFWQMAAPHAYALPDRIAFYGAVTGVALFTVSPFVQEGKAYLNNYVPLLDNTPFIWGIGLFICAVMLQAVLVVLRFCHPERRAASPQSKDILQHEILRFAQNDIFCLGVFTSAAIYILAFVALVLSYLHLSAPEIDFAPEQFYESFFWGGGHILQFLYAQIMLLGWWYLVDFQPKHTKYFAIALSLNLLFAAGSLATYIPYPAHEPEHISIFTDSMKYFGGVAAVLIALPLFGWIKRNWKEIPYRWLILCSMFMFGIGGALGYRIDGVNTIIPAHYHGSIVGVTLALMGVAYTLLSKLGLPIQKTWILTLQPILYSIGQLMHIIGLAWSGGYGALRKTPGAMESLEGQMAMGLMGMGGLLSVIGGVMFVLLCLMALCKKAK